MFVSKINLSIKTSFQSNHISSTAFLDIPFFFNGRSSTFYRFESTIYNFSEESLLKNFALTWGLNFKFTFKILMSMFFLHPSQRLLGPVESNKFYSHLFTNSFLNIGSANTINCGSFFSLSNVQKNFKVTLNNTLVQNLHNFSAYLSDECLDLRLSENRFKKVTHSGFQTVDSFVSTYNASLPSFDFGNSIGFISKVKFPRQSYVLIGSNAKTTSFFVSSIDNSLLYDTQWLALLRHKKYLIKKFDKLVLNTKFYKIYDKNLYLNTVNIIENNFKLSLDNLFKNFSKKVLNYNLRFIFADDLTSNLKILFFSKILQKSNLFFNKFLIEKFVFFFWFFDVISSKIYSFYTPVTTSLNTKLKISFARFFYKNSFKNLILSNVRPIFFNKILFSHRINHLKGTVYRQSNSFNTSNKAPMLRGVRPFFAKGKKNWNKNKISLFARYKFFISTFSTLVLQFFHQNFLIFSSSKINTLLNPKVLLTSYFLSIKFFFINFNKKFKTKFSSTFKGLSASKSAKYYYLYMKNRRAYIDTRRPSQNILKKTTKFSFKNTYLKEKPVLNFYKHIYKKKRFLRKLPNPVLNAKTSKKIKSSNFLFKRTYTNDTTLRLKSKNSFVYMYKLWEFFFKDNYSLFLKLFFVNFSKVTRTTVLFKSFVFYFFVSIFSLNSTMHKMLLPESSSFSFLLFTDLRYFILKNFLFSSRKKIDIFHFFSNNNKKLPQYSDFTLKVDITTYIIVRSYIEYFRTFKYNEYIFNNLFTNNNLVKNILTPSPLNFSRLLNYFPIRRKIFSRHFNFYRIYFYYNQKPFFIHYKFIFYLFSTLKFFSFFSVFVLMKKKFYKLFYIYFKSYISNYLFVSVFNIFSNDSTLNNELRYGYSNLAKPLFLLEELSLLNADNLFFYKTLIKYIRSFFFKNFITNKTIRNFFLFKHHFVHKANKSLTNLPYNNFLYYNIIYISSLHYMDRFYFKNYIPFEGYNYVNAFRFADVLLLNNSWKFFNTNSLYEHKTIFAEKLKLDLLLWDIFNFNILGYSLLHADVSFFKEKLFLDNLSFDRELNLAFFLQNFFSWDNINTYSINVIFLLNYCYFVFILKDLLFTLIYCSGFYLIRPCLLDLKRTYYKNYTFSFFESYCYFYYFNKFLANNKWNFFTPKLYG